MQVTKIDFPFKESIYCSKILSKAKSQLLFSRNVTGLHYNFHEGKIKVLSY